MFERYTERARRVLFFARYEASQLGSVSIETEHLLLGLIREGKGLTSRIFQRSHLSLESIRKEVEGRTVFREKVSTSVEIPFSGETKRVLQYAAEEADRLLHSYIGTEHLLLGILREERSVAASILMEKGMRLNTVRDDIVQLLNEKTSLTRVKETPLLAEFSRDLTDAAMKNTLDPLVGREHEIERVQQVLCRRTKNNAVLIGEPGVGKTAIVEGPGAEDRLRRRAALPRRQAPPGARHLADRRRHEVPRPVRRAPQGDHEGAVGEPERHRVHRRAAHAGRRRLGRRLARRRQHPQAGAVARRNPLHRRDHAGRVPRSTSRRTARSSGASRRSRSTRRREKETIEILRGVKDRYESFHHVEFTQEAIEAAVYQSSRYITDRFLPDKAIDLVDEAGARAKLREAGYSEEFGEINKTIRVAVEQMESAVSAKDFERANFYRQQEEAARENLMSVRERFDVKSSARRVVVNKQEIDEVVAKWTGVPMTAINEDESSKLLRMEDELHRRVISQEKAISALSRAIRRSRAGLKAATRPVGSFVFLGPTGRRQDRAGPRAGALPVRLGGRAHPLRHVRVHGEALGLEADRLASRLRRPRRGRPAHREGEAESLLGGPARRDREGAPRICSTSCCRCSRTAT